jgi:hypothetical protein
MVGSCEPVSLLRGGDEHRAEEMKATESIAAGENTGTDGTFPGGWTSGGSSNVTTQKAMTQEKPPPSPGPALVKLDFLIGTKWGSSIGRKQNRPSRNPNRRRNAPK